MKKIKTEQELIAKIVELKVALIDMLEQFGANYSLSAVENACALLNHPRTQSDTITKKQHDLNDDACYCRAVVYSKKEALRRYKAKLTFVDRTWKQEKK